MIAVIDFRVNTAKSKSNKIFKVLKRLSRKNRDLYFRELFVGPRK